MGSRSFEPSAMYLPAMLGHLSGWSTARRETGPPGTRRRDSPRRRRPTHPHRPRREREMMRRFAPPLALLALALATNAGANGIQGTVLKTNGQPVFPCNIDVFDRQTGQKLNVNGNATAANGTYNMILADGRYNLVFKPTIGAHVFQGTLQDQRVQGNTITSSITLPLGQYAFGKVVDK